MKNSMQSDELRRLRQSLGWNQARLGDEVGVSANTVARWERGASLVPKAVARLIRMLAADAAPSAVGASSGIARDTHHAAILKALSGHLDPEVFEACAADLLRQQWPGLVPVRGGSDDGFDGAIATDGEEPFPLVTTTGTAAKDNLRRNLKRAIGSGWTPKTAIFATSRRVTPKTRKAMRDVAREFGITLAQIYDQEWFANSLYRESGWCKRLLGVTGRPSALSIIPVSNRPVIGDRVIGRDACLEQLRSLDRDCLLVAGPGAGKTFVLRSLALEGVGLFLADDDREEIANALREQAPAAVIVDDAHVDIARLKLLQQLRTELHATFRIVAAGWRSHTDELKSALNLANKDVVELELLDRDTMVEVVKAAGIHGPNSLVREIVDQAGGRPGLAVTLVYLCSRGDVHDVFSGESLVAQLTPVLKRLVGEDVSRLLAAFSLAGEAGCTIKTVASYLGRPIDEISSILAQLSAAGVIRERHQQTISVWPAAFRWVLVRQIFFEGPGSLDYQDLYAELPDKNAALETLIGARSRGAAVPELEEFLEQHQSTQLWSDYASLGPRETRCVLAKHPELATNIASVALSHAPDEVIPHLLNEAVGDDRMLHNSLDHPLRKIENWMEKPEEYAGPRLERRRTLIDAVKDWWRNGVEPGNQQDTARTTLRAVAVAFTPSLSYGESDPGRGRTFTFSSGIPGKAETRAVQELWSVETEFIHKVVSASGAWTELLQLIREWESVFGVKADEEIVEQRRDFARGMVRDVAGWSAHLPGVQHCLSEMAARLDMSVPLEVDAEFEVLFPQEDLEHFRDREAEWNSKASDLATTWAKSDPSIVAAKIAHYQHQAEVAHITYPRLVPGLSANIADVVSDPASWAAALIDHEAPADAVWPFLERLAKGAPGDVGALLERCMQLDQYRWIAISILITMKTPPSGLFAQAADQAGDFQQLVEVNCLRGSVPPETLKALLTTSDDRTAIAAAIGSWNADRRGRSGLSCREEWEGAVLRSARVADIANRDGYWLAEILKSEPSLAYRWLVELLATEPRFLRYEQKKIAEEAVSALNKEQRVEVLGHMKADHVARELIKHLIGDDIDTYRTLLKRDELSDIHLEALEGQPREAWVDKAIAALDAGRTVDDVAIATLPTSWTWTGPVSTMWMEWRDAFAAFESHTDRRIAKVAARGVEIASERVEREREGERLEDF